MIWFILNVIWVTLVQISPVLGCGLKLISSHLLPAQTTDNWTQNLLSSRISATWCCSSQVKMFLDIEIWDVNHSFIEKTMTWHSFTRISSAPIMFLHDIERNPDLAWAWFYFNTLCKWLTVKFVIPKFEI